jgi:DNA-binding NtrC family response regulator
MEALTRYDWPGNIRELQNVLERSVILTHGDTLQMAMSDLVQTSDSSVLSPPRFEGVSRDRTAGDHKTSRRCERPGRGPGRRGRSPRHEANHFAITHAEAKHRTPVSLMSLVIWPKLPELSNGIYVFKMKRL